jgi:hypothetical protein
VEGGIMQMPKVYVVYVLKDGMWMRVCDFTNKRKAKNYAKVLKWWAKTEVFISEEEVGKDE